MMLSNTIRRVLDPFKKIEWLYALYYKRSLSKELAAAKREMKSYSFKKSEQIDGEIKCVKRYWKVNSVDFYIYYELFKKELTTEELLDYVPPFYFLNYHQMIKQKGIDKAKYKNKLNQYQLFDTKGIKTPTVIGVFKRKRLYDIFENELDPSEFIDRYLNSNDSKLFVKPVDGEGGTGILVIKRKEDDLCINDEIVEKEDLLREISASQSYIVQKGILQRQDISQINSSSVNTLRVIAQKRSGKMALCVCILRMSRGNAEVDNSAQGGLSIAIDINTGAFRDFASVEHGGGVYYSHPSSGFVFKDQIIKGWPEIRKEVQAYASRLIEFNEIALDVAITDNGIQIIELNLGYGIDHVQKTCGGMRKILSVQTPS